MTHTWQFFRAGGVEQVDIRNGDDLAHLAELDQKLWVALACPTRGIEFDTATLDLIDTDHDGRIRPPELIAAAHWACKHVKNPATLIGHDATIELDDIVDGTDAPLQMREEAAQVLALLGKGETTQISLEDIQHRDKIIAAMRFNGDGVITPATAEDETLGGFVDAIMKVIGSVPDVSGNAGLDHALATAYFEQLDAQLAWHDKGKADEASIFPLGDQSVFALKALQAVSDKIDDYFTRCRLAQFDAQAQAALSPAPDDYKNLAQDTLNTATEKLLKLPIAAIQTRQVLPLDQGLNPAWQLAVDALRQQVITPMLGEQTALSLSQWETVKARLAPTAAWLAGQPDNALRGTDPQTLQALNNTELRARLFALIEQDKAKEQSNARLANLEKLLRFKRDLLTLTRNFVSFQDFYARKEAIFQAGTLYLDSRSCDLTVHVENTAQHATLAGMAKVCLAYCTCTRDGQTKQIVAAFTAGDTDFLFIGRHGVFYDRKGQDWDATITKLIDNPTSIREAFFSPYKKFLRLIEEQVAKRAAASEEAANAKLGTAATNLSNADKTPAPESANKVDVGTVAALGVALGSISAVIVGIFAKFIDLGIWIPVGIIGIILAISGPSMLIAWLKLRQRSLGPILDASGWAINGRMKINVRLGTSLSRIAAVPRNAHRRLSDPYADSHRGAWLLVILALLAIIAFASWRQGWLNPMLPDNWRYATEPLPAVAAPADPNAEPEADPPTEP